jgi:MFS family permease
MLQRKHRPWLIVAVLFATVAFIFGGTVSTPGVFFAPLIREFGWSHARVSSLASAVTLGTIPGSVAVGFLLEEVDGRMPIVAGAALTAAALICASQADSYSLLLLSYFVAGFGVAMATLIPAALVVANWFQTKRGLAMGIALSGVSAGGMIMVQVATRVIRSWGWRAGYAALALPILLIVVPLVLLVVRSHPLDVSVQAVGSEAGDSSRSMSNELEGFDLSSAIWKRSFWLIAVAGFLFAFIVYGILTQLVIYLLGVGYRPGAAAIVLSLTLGLNFAGKIFFGMAADSIGARWSLTLSFAIMGFGIILLLGSTGIEGLAAFLLVYGPAWGAPLMLLPLVTMESLGLKHYGSLGGVLRMPEACGAVLGPVALGRIFDLTSSYRSAFSLCLVCAAVGAAASLGCEKFSSEAVSPAKLRRQRAGGLL